MALGSDATIGCADARTYAPVRGALRICCFLRRILSPPWWFQEAFCETDRCTKLSSDKWPEKENKKNTERKEN